MMTTHDIHARTPRALRLAAVAALMAGAGLTGCARKTITVTTEPPGALVWLNDREIGRSPVSVEFYDYGTYDVRLELDGYEPMMTFGVADPPPWDLPGPDLVFEAVPGASVNRHWHYDLEPAIDNTPQLLDRARTLRAAALQPDTEPTGTADPTD
ncbi:MAG: PEGA domain-containing protein [Phycisphaerales bacterium]|nr:PEGA domain-containing protein [Phycisphaerales bacterium]